MHGFCGILGLSDNYIDKKAFKKSINLAETMHIETVTENNFFSVVSFLDKSPLNGARIYSNKDLIFLFAGDLIGYQEIPWIEIENNVLKSNFEWFSTLRGLFAFVIYNIKTKKIILIGDHFIQLPVYYGVFEGSFIFSTDLSTFTTLTTVPEFNVEWLFEYMFFNYPILGTTFFKGVKRLRPNIMLNYNRETESISEIQYGEFFKKEVDIIVGKEALDINIKMFEDRIPKYYCEKKINLVAISGGFDSRTILSLASKKSNVETYTYGVENSGDLETVSTFINKLDIKHEEVLFDANFKKKLSTLIYETIRLSGGIQPIIRSTLLHVYKSLSKNKEEKSVVIGGINGDFFRGLGFDIMSEGSIVSYGMKMYFNSGKTVIDDKRYPLKKQFQNDFKNHIKKRLEKIELLYGNPKSDKSIMSYTIYEENPNYFGGEMALAENYFTFRQPFWDFDLISMAYSTEVGHIGYLKRFKENRDTTYSKYVLQAKVITSNPKFKKTYIHGLPISLFTFGNKPLLKVGRLFIRGFAYIKGYRKPINGLEEWDDWFKDDLKDEFDKVLNKRSLILEYIDEDFMNSVKKQNDIHLLSKLVTTEIIINLIKNRWDLFL